MSALSGSLAVLDGAIAYALDGAARVTPADLSRPTPCAAWDLATLVDHVADAMAVLHDALDPDRVERIAGGDSVAEQRDALGPDPVGRIGGTDSVARLHDALDLDPDRVDRIAAADPVARLRARAARLLAVCAADDPVRPPVRVGDRALPAGMVAVTGALEIAVHAWDIWSACGVRRPIPPGLAIVLQPIAPLLVPACVRPGLFADPVRLTCSVEPADELLAFLGRRSF